MPGVDIFDSVTHDYTKKSIVLFKSAQEFSEYIERNASKQNISLVSAVIEYCEMSDLDYEHLSSMLTNNIKEKIAAELREDGFLTRVSQIQFED